MNASPKPMMVILCWLLSTWGLFAQENAFCFDFDQQFEKGAELGLSSGSSPGDSIWGNERLTLRLESFLYSDGQTGFRNLVVSDELFNPELFPTEGLYGFVGNVNLNFTLREATARQVCFRFLDGGGEVNLGVNGQALNNLQSFSELDGAEIAPGVTVSVRIDEDLPSPNLPRGAVCLNGPIESLTVGGQESGLDDICFSFGADSTDCPIRELEASILDCTASGLYDIEVDPRFSRRGNFNPAEPINIIIDNYSFGPFPLDSFPIVFEEVEILTEAANILVATCAAEQTNCCARLLLNKADCREAEPESQCIGFESLPPEAVYGASAGQNPGDGFELPGPVQVSLIPLQTLTWIELFGDLTVFPSTARLNFPQAEGPYLFYEELATALNFSEYPEPVETLTIDIALLDGVLNLAANGGDILKLFQLEAGAYELGDGVTVQVQPLRNSPGGARLSFSGAIRSLLIGGERLAVDNLCINPESEPECRIGDIVAEPLPCDDQGQFKILLDFAHENTSETFALFLNGDSLASYSYSQLPIEIGPFSSFTDESRVVEIRDNERNCRAEKALEAYECPPACEIGAIDAQPVNCNSSGAFSVALNFESEGASPFLLRINGEEYGEYRKDDLPITVGSFTADDQPLEIEVVAISGECRKATVIDDFVCEERCVFQEFTVEAGTCEDGQFNARINISTRDTSEQGYYLFANGRLFGPYSYRESELEIGPFLADGLTVYDFLVIDIESPNCFAYAEVGPVSCDPPCRIGDLTAEFLGCNPDGSYTYRIDFAYENPENEFFDLYLNDSPVNYYPLSDLPITVELFLPDTPETPPNQLKACINDRADCCARVALETPSCEDEPPAICPLDRLEASVTECDSAGFYLDLELGAEAVGADSSGQVQVYFKGGALTVLNYADFPARIGPVNYNAAGRYKFTFIDSLRPDCRFEAVFDEIDCERSEWQEAVQVWPGDANRDNAANFYDLLNIGIAFGAEGQARTETSVAWKAVTAPGWEQSFANGVNYKHADCNGDGIINAADTLPISGNYGLTHGEIQPVDTLPSTDLDPPIFVDFPESETLTPGQAVRVPIVLGDASAPVNDLYGLAFQLKFEPGLFEASSLRLEYPTSWFGQPGVNVIQLDKKFAEEGKIDIALSRTDQNEVSGYGDIIYLYGIIDDIAGLTDEAGFEVRNALALDLKQRAIPLLGKETQVAFKRPEEIVGRLDLHRSLRVFPNPTSGTVRVANGYGLPVSSIEILTTAGQVMRGPIENRDRFSMANLPSGLYIVRIEIGGYVFHERVIKTQ